MTSYGLFDTLLDGAIIVDETQNIVHVNEAAGNLCGIPVKRFKEGQPLEKYLKFEPNLLGLSNDLMALAETTPYEEVTLKSSNGTDAKVRACVQPLAGTKNRFLILLRDVTLEEALQKKYRSQLEQKEVVIKTLEETCQELSEKNTQLDQKVYETTLLFEISRTLIGFSDREYILEELAKKLLSFHVCQAALILLPDENQKSLKVLSFVGKEKSECDKRMLQIPIENAPFPLERINDEGVFDAKTEPTLFKFVHGVLGIADMKQVLAIPLSTQLYRGGSLHIVRSMQHPSISPDDIRLLRSIASQTAVALESSQNFEKSITDEMTRIYNKRYFLSQLDNELDKSSRRATPMSLLLLDVDHFKKFNDTYGHQTGDLVLKKVAQVMKQVCRKYDVPARYGGEEFAVILPGTDTVGATVIAERLRKSIADTVVESGGSHLKVTTSIGLATAPEHAKNAHAIVEAADKALYEAKKAGRNCTKACTKKAA